MVVVSVVQCSGRKVTVVLGATVLLTVGIVDVVIHVCVSEVD